MQLIRNHAAKKWTEGSIYCYKRGCVCKGCYMNNMLESSKCQMKTAVIELVRKLGVPKEVENE